MSTSYPMPVTETPRPLVLALGGFVALAAAVGIGRFVYTPILALMVEVLGMSQGTAGLLASANFMGYLAGALLAATPTVPGSRRNWLLLSLVMSSLTTGGMAFASSTAAFLTLRFAGGVASAFVLVLASALVLDRLSAAGRPDLAAVHAFACGIEAVGVAASVLWLTPAGVLLAAALLGGTFMGITALGLVRARCLSSGDPRPTLAVMTAAFGLGQIVGPAFAGVIYDATGTFLVPSLTAASALLAGALLALRGST